MNFDAFVKLTSKVKNIPLPAEASQFKMSPPFRQELIKRFKDEMKTAKRAGVMALFYPDIEQQTHLVLILRNTYKGVHSAQIGFPGGKFEEGDSSLEDTAKRETFEEVGVPMNHIEVLQEMTEIYIPPSNFYVQPYMGILRSTPKFIKQDHEVNAIIEVPLMHFMDDDVVITKRVSTSYSISVDAPAFELNGHIVWGATAMMLNEIKDLLKALL